MMMMSDDEGDYERKGKIVGDPIHGQISLSPLLVRVLDTPEFQRLRDLKQLGSAYLVFPGASHNRFEHCIGVAHLAEQMLTHIRDTQPELNVTARDMELVKLAGLCHDLGHGPFSHLFEDFVHAADPSNDFHHERMSLQLLELLLQRHDIPMPAADMQFLRELINPTHNPTQSHESKFLYDIVANARNSVDVDKFDYLQRDCHNLGMSTNLKHDRLIRHCRVIDDEICYNSKEVYNLYDLFHTRYSLHKQVYTHRVSKSIEFMICDVFKLADSVLGLSAATRSPAAYVKLTDCVLKEIENSVDPRLAAARALLLRIRTRKLYRLVDETVLPVDSHKVLGSVTAKQILDCHPPSRAILSESDLRIHNLRINYSMADKNPVDMIKFFHKSQPDLSFHIPKQQVSHVIPAHFQERILRVFLTDVTPEKYQEAQKAVNWFLDHNECLPPSAALPIRSRSSPPEIHSAEPLRGGSVFARGAGRAAIDEGDEERDTDTEGAAQDAADADADMPPSQGTAATAELAEEQAHINGSSEAVGEGELVAPRTPTRRAQAKSSRRSGQGQSAQQANRELSPPSTVLLNRYAPREDDDMSSGAAAASAAAAAPAASGASASLTPQSTRTRGASVRSSGGSGSGSLAVPSASPFRRDREGSSPTATPQKRRHMAFTNPATPAGKLAAQVVASRGNTPAMGSRFATPSSAGAAAGITPATNAKKQKVVHNTPLPMQQLPPPSARASQIPPQQQLPPAPPADGESKDSGEGVEAASARPTRSNSKKSLLY